MTGAATLAVVLNDIGIAHDRFPTDQQAMRRVERREEQLERLGADEQAVGVGQDRPDGVSDVVGFIVVNAQIPVAAQVGHAGVGLNDDLLRCQAGGEAAVEIRRQGRGHLTLEHQIGIAGEVVELEQDPGHGVGDEEVKEELLWRAGGSDEQIAGLRRHEGHAVGQRNDDRRAEVDEAWAAKVTL